MSDRDPVFGQVDLTNCDREPIHIPGSIQPHGVLLALDSSHAVVEQVAGSTERLLGVPPEEIIGQRLDNLLGASALYRLQAVVAQSICVPHPQFAFEALLQTTGQMLDAVVHMSGGGIIVELEPRLEMPQGNPLVLVQEMIQRLQASQGVDDFLDGVAHAVRGATGFDRVMIYRFLEDDSGAVVAEARGPEIESYLGLRYPASDIPVQARAMYLKSWIRLIPDARYTPAPLQPPLNPQTNRPLDLTHAVLRAVSPLHLEYLANMGVAASMSLSLVVGGKLWGLVACHHQTVRHLPHGVRAACELFAQMASLHLSEKLIQAEQALRLRAKTTLPKLIEIMTQDEDLASALTQYQPNLQDYIPANGVVVWWEGKATSKGVTPSGHEIAALVAWLNATMREGVFITDRLSELYPPAAAYAAIASGLVALSISRDPKDYVLWFRPELLETVTWAGNPAKPVEPGDDGERLSPRKSFAAWRETVRGRSRAWNPGKQQAAQDLRLAILEIVLRRLDLITRERERARAQQDFLMAELDHRVKNTLATIQALVLYSARHAQTLRAFTETIQQRLHALARTHDLLTRGRWAGADLSALVHDEMDMYGAARVTIAGPVVTLKPKAALSLSLAVHELATNSVKYGALSADGGQVTIFWKVPPGADAAPALAFAWIERNGPEVTQPTHKGFGRTVIEQMLAFEVRSTVDLRFSPDGVTCTAIVPADLFEMTQSASAEPLPISPRALPDPARELTGRRVLVVEDQTLIAIELQDLLERDGLVVVGPFGQLDSARAAATSEGFDAALLDVDLDGERSWDVADILIERGIPFAFTTAYQREALFPARFDNAVVLAKPYMEGVVLEGINRLLAQGTRA
ncbi:HWE histidine kinase domain-containing protein [Azorhizobium sp. AG788]|uniref:HWE histidine kinase domain-containing protein n=1 Tax=Azorhizobium sp. AG788 TaxID=2183897 RepID=UPI00313A0771